MTHEQAHTMIVNAIVRAKDDGFQVYCEDDNIVVASSTPPHTDRRETIINLKGDNDE